MNHELVRKCQPDKNLRYYLTYDVETKEYRDKVILFLSYKDVAGLLKDKVCFVERTLKEKPKPKIIEVPYSPRRDRDFDRFRY